jgi:hypothetical protein
MDAGSSVLPRILIGKRGGKVNRPFVEAVALALTLAVVGCGGDDEEGAATTATQPPTATVTAPTETAPTEPEPAEPEPEPAEPQPAEPQPPTSPEEQPGGAGDEEPARTLALFTGEGGRITPPVVRVPAYISIRVELRSGDGRRYALTFDGESIAVGGGLGSVSTTIDALRPGQAIVGTAEGASNRVRIAATAEPGP